MVLEQTHDPVLDSEDEDDKEKTKRKKGDGFQPSPKMNVIVGFLRLANYVCVCTVIFGLFVSLLYPKHPSEPPSRDFRLWQVQHEIVFLTRI